jgi:protocatechuate 3,4-dioxygenase beta subunit
MLALLGGAGVALIVGCSGDDNDAPAAPSATGAPSSEMTPEPTSSTTASSASEAVTGEASMPLCIVTPELTEGPYFVDERLERSDIRTDPGGAATREGAELTLTLTVYQVTATGCETLEGAMVDIWHCDALGRYSDVRDNGAGFDTTGEKWLRGFQTSDASGQVSFTTIYPGWYQGRATHVHFKVRRDDLEFTSQFFFDDALSDEVHSSGVYAEKGAAGRLQNEADNIYGESGGQLLLNTMQDGDSYVAGFGIGLQM